MPWQHDAQLADATDTRCPSNRTRQEGELIRFSPVEGRADRVARKLAKGAVTLWHACSGLSATDVRDMARPGSLSQGWRAVSSRSTRIPPFRSLPV